MNLPKDIPSSPGVYLMKNVDGDILYIGKSKCLIKRVRSYFQKQTHAPKIQQMLQQVDHLEFMVTDSEIAALVLEARLIKKLQPKYNTAQKDDKSSPYWAITKDLFPRAMIVYEFECVPKENFYLLGPFLDASALRQSFKILQKIFRFRTCNLKISPDSPPYSPCLLAAINYCSAPCAKRICIQEYQNDIQKLQQFLEGESSQLIFLLKKEMEEFSLIMEFEKAAKWRDQILALEKLKNIGLKHSSDKKNPFLAKIDVQESLIFLQNLLHLLTIPHIIEGIDIAHYQGKEAVGSMVCFVDGVPYKKGYRQYKIQGNYTQNDFAMLQEVLHRRFSNYQENDNKFPSKTLFDKKKSQEKHLSNRINNDRIRELPNVLLVDGGKGQLHAARTVLKSLKIENVTIISLAKKKEEIFFSENSEPLNLPANSIVHHLLCHIRDEAHRFAQRYHHKLQQKKIMGDYHG